MTAHRTPPGTGRDRAPWRKSHSETLAELIGDALAAAHADDARAVDVAGLAADVALAYAAEWITTAGYPTLARVLLDDELPRRVFDSRTADDKLRDVLAERFGVVFAPVLGGAS